MHQQHTEFCASALRCNTNTNLAETKRERLRGKGKHNVCGLLRPRSAYSQKTARSHSTVTALLVSQCIQETVHHRHGQALSRREQTGFHLPHTLQHFPPQLAASATFRSASTTMPNAFMPLDSNDAEHLVHYCGHQASPGRGRRLQLVPPGQVHVEAFSALNACSPSVLPAAQMCLPAPATAKQSRSSSHCAFTAMRVSVSSQWL